MAFSSIIRGWVGLKETEMYFHKEREKRIIKEKDFFSFSMFLFTFMV